MGQVGRRGTFGCCLSPSPDHYFNFDLAQVLYDDENRYHHDANHYDANHYDANHYDDHILPGQITMMIIFIHENYQIHPGSLFQL